MERYSTIYLIGALKRSVQDEPVHPIAMQILVGDSNHQWLEPHYVDRAIRPLGDVAVLIPTAPSSSNALIDACIAFFPERFVDCPALEPMHMALAGVRYLDFTYRDSVPLGWMELREQARPYFAQLDIRRAVLQPLPVWQMDPSTYWLAD